MNESFNPRKTAEERIEAERILNDDRVSAWLDHNNPKNIEDIEQYQALGVAGSWMPTIDTVLPDENGIIKHNDDLYADMSIEQLLDLSADAEFHKDRTTRLSVDKYITDRIYGLKLSREENNDGRISEADASFLLNALINILRDKKVKELSGQTENANTESTEETTQADAKRLSKPPSTPPVTASSKADEKVTKQPHKKLSLFDQDQQPDELKVDPFSKPPERKPAAKVTGLKRNEETAKAVIKADNKSASLEPPKHSDKRHLKNKTLNELEPQIAGGKTHD